MRVVSLVPSWTETLLEAGVEVVGRTRFCVHPKERVKDLPRVGGTKDWNWPRVLQLKPDLLVLDQEENPKWMAEQSEIPYVSTHVTSLHSLPGAFDALSGALGSSESLRTMAERARRLSEWRGMSRWEVGDDLPGLIEWGRVPSGPIRQIVYVIWRDPWMAVSRDTFIGSVLTAVGLGPYLPAFFEKYPRFAMEDFNPTDTLLLFSSEPYPFLRRRSELAALPFAHAFIDGECFSWFGVRTLRFLETLTLRSEATESR